MRFEYPFPGPNCNVDHVVLLQGQGIVIVDAGGGTIDVSTYSRTASNTKMARFEEIAISKCLLFNPAIHVMRF
jgi:hypothetical protein